MSHSSLSVGLYYEDYIINGVYITTSRNIGHVDVEAFSRLTLDVNPLHVDPVEMKQHPYKKPVVHGMLVASIAVGLISCLGLTRKTLVAMLDQRIVYKKPVYVGDTVHVKMEVIDKRETGNPTRGIVVYRYEVLNEAGVVVVEGTNTNMVFRKNTLKQNGEKK
ncbi:MAG: MaoC family dehydratase N-terminal domain-containing protein [Deltaproteobacteria bacterium]|nr:MaoC family dehydratase N-terminal domain-containing protein [Deltaproteobacteria bacterium]